MEKLIPVRSLFKDTATYAGQEVKLGGWVRNLRASKNFGFINLSDGTFFSQVQIVYGAELANFAEISKLNIGAAVIVTGMLVETPEQPPVETLLAKFENVDVVIVEGFKNEGAFPKIEVRRQAVSQGVTALSLTHSDIIAVASDWDEPGTRVPRLDVNDPSAVADFITNL